MILDKIGKNYFNIPVLLVGMLGFSSGIPLALTGFTLTMWLSRLEIDVKTIGLFSLVSLPFTIKYLWSFIFDSIPLPYFSRNFGFRRSWLVLIQLLLMTSIIFLGKTSPDENIELTAIFGFLVAFFSASQDIIVDALRIEILEDEQQAPGASSYVYGYRIAMLTSGAGAILLASHYAWNLVYVFMGSLILVGVVACLFIQEPKYSTQRMENFKHLDLISYFKTAVIDPFLNFFRRERAAYILIFLVIYKFPDALLASLQGKFYTVMGFSNEEIAYISKGFGFAMTLIGVFLGGIIFSRISIYKSLMIAGILQMVSNLFFILIEVNPSVFTLSLAIAIENITGSMNNIVIITFLSGLCDIKYTATQYAILNSFCNIGRTILAAPAGYIVSSFGWSNFFVFSAVVGVPSLAILYLISNNLKNEN